MRGAVRAARPLSFGDDVDEAAWAHVEQVVDGDRTVATFFAPQARRRPLLALYAFDQEVARIGLTVREPMAGHIRLAWWREQVAAAYEGTKLQAPVPQALAEVVRANALPHAVFEAYLDARAFDLEEAPFADEAAMDAHARSVGGGFVQLAARVLGAEHRADAAAMEAGVAIVLARHIGEAAADAGRRRCRLPLSWLAEAGVNAEDLFAARELSGPLSAVFTRMRGLVRRHLGALNASAFPRAATPALAVATLARLAPADPFRPRATADWQRLARLSLANLTWRF